MKSYWPMIVIAALMAGLFGGHVSAIEAESVAASSAYPPPPPPPADTVASVSPKEQLILALLAAVLPMVVSGLRNLFPTLHLNPEYLPGLAALLGEGVVWLLPMIGVNLPGGSGIGAGILGVGARQVLLKTIQKGLVERVGGVTGLWIMIGLLMPGLMAPALMLGGSGCASKPNDGGAAAQSKRLVTAANLAAYVGTAEIVGAHPEYRKGFEIALEDLKTLEAGEVNAAALMQIVGRLPVKELKSGRAAIIIGVATILLEDQIGSMPLEKIDDLKPVIAAIRSGIEQGLK